MQIQIEIELQSGWSCSKSENIYYVVKSVSVVNYGEGTIQLSSIDENFEGGLANRQINLLFSILKKMAAI